MAEVGEIYPGTGERIVGKIANPSGPGFYLQGENGGVFAEGGAPYLGGYFDANMAQHRNDPNRRFSGIRATEGGGYESMIAGGTTGYAFNPTAPAPTVAPAPTPAQQRATSETGTSAKATLAATLEQFGLPSTLVGTLWDSWYVNEGRPIGQIMLDLETTPEYKTRFPAIGALRAQQKAGANVYVPSPAEYVDFERTATSLMRAAGLPEGFYDSPDDFTNLLVKQVSPSELNDRIQGAKVSAYQTAPETRDFLSRELGITDGDLTAFWLNPDKALPVIQSKVTAGEIGGAASKAGFDITGAQAEGLQGGQVTGAMAEQRFGELGVLKPLFSQTVGEATTGTGVGLEDVVGSVGGSAASTEKIRTAKGRRQAVFQGGGGAASGGGQGGTGLGGG